MLRAVDHESRISAKIYLFFSQQFFIYQFCVNGAHCNRSKGKSTTAVEVIFDFSRNDLYNVFNANAKLTFFIVSGLWIKFNVIFINGK